MTKFNVPHVQTVLKITESPVQTRISRLEQSQSWNFMKCAVIKITAYWGQTPPQKFDRMCIDNHFWPTIKGKYFKMGGLNLKFLILNLIPIFGNLGNLRKSTEIKENHGNL